MTRFDDLKYQWWCGSRQTLFRWTSRSIVQRYRVQTNFMSCFFQWNRTYINSLVGTRRVQTRGSAPSTGDWILEGSRYVPGPVLKGPASGEDPVWTGPRRRPRSPDARVGRAPWQLPAPRSRRSRRGARVSDPSGPSVAVGAPSPRPQGSAGAAGARGQAGSLGRCRIAAGGVDTPGPRRGRRPARASSGRRDTRLRGRPRGQAATAGRRGGAAPAGRRPAGAAVAAEEGLAGAAAAGGTRLVLFDRGGGGRSETEAGRGRGGAGRGAASGSAAAAAAVGAGRLAALGNRSRCAHSGDGGGGGGAIGGRRRTGAAPPAAKERGTDRAGRPRGAARGTSARRARASRPRRPRAQPLGRPRPAPTAAARRPAGTSGPLRRRWWRRASDAPQAARRVPEKTSEPRASRGRGGRSRTVTTAPAPPPPGRGLVAGGARGRDGRAIKPR